MRTAAFQPQDDRIARLDDYRDGAAGVPDREARADTAEASPARARGAAEIVAMLAAAADEGGSWTGSYEQLAALREPAVPLHTVRRWTDYARERGMLYTHRAGRVQTFMLTQRAASSATVSTSRTASTTTAVTMSTASTAASPSDSEVTGARARGSFSSSSSSASSSTDQVLRDPVHGELAPAGEIYQLFGVVAKGPLAARWARMTPDERRRAQSRAEESPSRYASPPPLWLERIFEDVENESVLIRATGGGCVSSGRPASMTARVRGERPARRPPSRQQAAVRPLVARARAATALILHDVARRIGGAA